jgi:hypothetical protein
MVGRLVRAVAAATLALVVTLALVEGGLRALGLGDPILYDNRAAYGYRPIPNQTRRRLLGAQVSINGLGVRGPEVTPERPDGTVRLLFLGDSVTWGGSLVDDHDVFPAVAARTLEASVDPASHERIESLDAGANAWGPQNVLGLVIESGGFDSSVWVLTLLQDDFRREKTHLGEVPFFGVSPHTAIEELAVYGAYRFLSGYRQHKPPEDLERLAHDNLGVIGAIVESAHLAGARVLLVWHPAANEVPPYPPGSRLDALRETAHEYGVEVLDLTEAYTASPEPVWSDGMHLTTAGHRVAGEAIGKKLVEMGVGQ